jgi:hypothetical protein
MSKNIIFINSRDDYETYPPEPASKLIPIWYKDLDSYIDGKKVPDGNGMTTATAKRCMPVFDAVTSGYIIKSSADIFVTQKENENGVMAPWYEWSNHTVLNFHPAIQAPYHPLKKDSGDVYPKWMNCWGIKTPKGYSTLFVQPFHRNSDFTILPGIVDTDKYFAPVNFPFTLNDSKFEGLIPAGTPIAQAIPFKRDNFKMVFGNDEDLKEQTYISGLIRSSFFDSYKNRYRQLKEYK